IEDPKELLEIPAPETGLLACEDQSDFYRDDLGGTGRATTSYFADISVDRSKGYFNAGVLKFTPEQWRTISAECLAYLQSNLAICRYHDQSALNAVAGRTRVRLSPVWNFQSPYFGWGLERIAKPRLLHFVGGWKPWMGELKVWSDIYADYDSVIRKHSDPVFPLKAWSASERAEVLSKERRINLKLRTVFYHGVLLRRRHYRRLVENSVGRIA